MSGVLQRRQQDVFRLQVGVYELQVVQEGHTLQQLLTERSHLRLPSSRPVSKMGRTTKPIPFLALLVGC